MTTSESTLVRWAQMNHFAHHRLIGRRGEAHDQALARWLREHDLSGELQDDPRMPADPVILSQWAQMLGEKLNTVQDWRRREGWSATPRLRARWAPGSGRSGRTPEIYSLSELEEQPRPRTRRIEPHLFEEGEYLTLHTIAVRGGLTDHLDQTLYHHRHSEGFPAPIENAGEHEARPNAEFLYEARAVVEFFNQLPGRRGKRKTG